MITLTRPPTMGTAGRSFRLLREHAGVSQTEAARYMGVSNAALCRYERGEPKLGAWRILRCADWLAEKAREREAA